MPYQDKQLKKEFITVDNRTIPFGYPQFWGGDDWEVSGRDNPLPVANYTRNEQGLWVPVSKENPVPTQLTGSLVEERIFENITIPSNSFISYTGIFPTREVKVLLRFDKTTKYRVLVRPFGNGLGHLSFVELYAGEGIVLLNPEYRENRSKTQNMRIYNDSDEEVLLETAVLVHG